MNDRALDGVGRQLAEDRQRGRGLLELVLARKRLNIAFVEPPFRLHGTDQGIRGIKESPNRLAAASKLAETLGVKIKAAYWTFGQYDMVVISEGSDEAIAAWMYKVGSAGNIRSTTLRAFTGDELQRIVAKIP